MKFFKRKGDALFRTFSFLKLSSQLGYLLLPCGTLSYMALPFKGELLLRCEQLITLLVFISLDLALQGLYGEPGLRQGLSQP